MPSVDIDLGSIGLISTNSDLQLTLSNLARCSCADETYSSEELIHTILDQHGKTRPWFLLSSFFDFCINFRADETIPTPSWEALRETLPATIEAAEIWRQLELLPAQSTVSIDEDDISFTLTLRLIHDNSEPSQTGRRIPHKIDVDVPPSHVKPPAGVLQITVERVELDFNVSNKSVSQRDLSQRIDLPTAENSLDSKPSSQTLAFSSQPINNLSSSQPSTQLPLSKSLLPDLHSLISSALLTTLSTHPRNLSPGIKLATHLAFKPLDQLFPPLFAPAFLSTVAQKAKFIPTINSAILNVAKRAQGSTLGVKAAELERRSRKREGQKSEGVSTALWQMVQRETAGRTVGRKLKPVFVAEKKEKKKQGSGSQSQAVGEPTTKLGDSFSRAETAGEIERAGGEEDEIMDMMMKGSSSPVKEEKFSQPWTSSQGLDDEDGVMEGLVGRNEDEENAFWDRLLNGTDEEERLLATENKENDPHWPHGSRADFLLDTENLLPWTQSTIKKEVASQPRAMPQQFLPPSSTTKIEDSEDWNDATFWQDLMMEDTTASYQYTE